MTHGLARVVSHEDGVEHVASAHLVGPTERIAVLGCGGIPRQWKMVADRSWGRTRPSTLIFGHNFFQT